jgi:hypothetical protein
MNKQILAQRIADALTAKGVAFEEKKMFGGVCFMVAGKMCLGANHDHKLMARVDPGESEHLAERTDATIMVHGGRVMPGYMFVEPAGFESDADLDFWVDKCLKYNPKAKASKKKRA